MRRALLLCCSLLLPGVLLPAQRALTATEAFRISAADEDLSVVSSVAVSDRGVIAVGQPQDHRIIFFDRTGQRLEAFGRDGEGPGEFRTMILVGWFGDTLAVQDSRTSRITRIFPDRKLLRTTPFVLQMLPPGGSDGSAPIQARVYVHGEQANGNQVASIGQYPNTTPPKWLAHDNTQVAPWVVLRPDGRVVRRLGDHARTPECLVSWSSGQSSGGAFVPWCAQGYADASPGGGFAGFVTPCRPGAYGVTLVDAMRGDTLFSISYTYRPVPVTKQQADSIREQRARGPSIPGQSSAFWRDMPVAEHFPGLSRLLVGRDGSVWLQEFDRIPEYQRWHVFNRRGEPLGVVALEGQVSVLEVYADHFWGTMADDDGLQDVVEWRLR
ncbi:MAG: hypothetical protein R3B35_15240 [Gemmatimonadales bacterium]